VKTVGSADCCQACHGSHFGQGPVLAILAMLAPGRLRVAPGVGDVPDLVFMDAPETILPQNAWDDKIIDVSDVVAPYESQLSDTAKLCSTFYNKVTRKRSYYLCPIKQGTTPFHIWGDLVEKAGLKMVRCDTSAPVTMSSSRSRT
jgi:hypothetical protein